MQLITFGNLVDAPGICKNKFLATFSAATTELLMAFQLDSGRLRSQATFQNDSTFYQCSLFRPDFFFGISSCYIECL